MSDLTKNALGESLRRELKDRPLNKITISDITDGCGVNRMTFYYHFHDIYELVEWMLEKEGEEALAGKLTAEGWQEGLANVFKKLKENKKVVMNINRGANQELLENYFNTLVEAPISKVIEGIAGGRKLAKADEDFMIAFYKYAFIGIVRAWVNNGMKEKPDDIIQRITVIVGKDIAAAVDRFATA